MFISIVLKDRAQCARLRRANKSPSSFSTKFIQKSNFFHKNGFVVEKNITGPLITKRYRWLSQIDRPDDALDDHRPKIFDLRREQRESSTFHRKHPDLSQTVALMLMDFLSLSRSRSSFVVDFLSIVNYHCAMKIARNVFSRLYERSHSHIRQ